jgi:anti-sigma factor RsiW
VTAHVQESLGAYVLGSLEPEEAAAVRAHLDRCTACAAEHAGLAKLPALLELASAVDATARPPLAPTVEERVLDDFARAHPTPPRPPRRRRRLALRLGTGFVAAAAAAAAALVLFLNGGQRAHETHAYAAVALHGTGAAPRASADAGLESVPGGTVVNLWVRNLPADTAAVYEVRCEAPGWSASAGTFRVDSHGRAHVVLTTAARRGEYDMIRIVSRQREPDGSVRMAAVLDGRLS